MYIVLSGRVGREDGTLTPLIRAAMKVIGMNTHHTYPESIFVQLLKLKGKTGKILKK